MSKDTTTTIHNSGDMYGMAAVRSFVIVKIATIADAVTPNSALEIPDINFDGGFILLIPCRIDSH